MSRGIGSLQAKILSVLDEPLTTREAMERVFKCPHGRLAECEASAGLSCSPGASRKQLMVRAHRALAGLAARDLVEGTYTHYAPDDVPAHPAITIVWSKKGQA